MSKPFHINLSKRTQTAVQMLGSHVDALFPEIFEVAHLVT
jgi:hypothetical protein